jgi:hypothetical protein
MFFWKLEYSILKKFIRKFLTSIVFCQQRKKFDLIILFTLTYFELKFLGFWFSLEVGLMLISGKYIEKLWKVMQYENFKSV